MSKYDFEDDDNKEFNGSSDFEWYIDNNKNQVFAKDLVSDIGLPAHLFDGKESCGKYRIVGCKEIHDGDCHCGYARKEILRCNEKGCRICFVPSIQRQSIATSNRLITFTTMKNNYRLYRKKSKSWNRKLKHVVVSPPEELHYLYRTKKGRKQLRKMENFILNCIYDRLKDKLVSSRSNFDVNRIRHEVNGSVVIEHPYRFNKDAMVANFSPHFHHIMSGWLNNELVDIINKKTKWVITDIRELDSWEECYQLTRYLLSHSATFTPDLDTGRTEHSVRYMGDMNNRKFESSSVLKFCKDSYDDLDKIFSDRESYLMKKKGIISRCELSRVSYTHYSGFNSTKISKLKDDSFFKFVDGDISKLTRSLKEFIKPEDMRDPVSSRSDDSVFEFISVRLDYAESGSIVNSVYINLVLDNDKSHICPECSGKLRFLVPKMTEQSDIHRDSVAYIVNNLPLDETVKLDDMTVFDYYSDVRELLAGIPYYDSDGMMQEETGVYKEPSCIENLGVDLYCSIINNIAIQKERYQWKLNSHEYGERFDRKKVQKLLHKPLVILNQS